MGPNLSQGRVLCVPRDGSYLSRTPSRPKCLCLLVFRLPDHPKSPTLSFLSLLVWFLPRKTPKFTKDFLPLPNPQNPWKRQRKHLFKQGNSLLKIYQGNPNKQGKEGQGKIEELIRFEFLRCKNYVTAPEINSPRGPKSPEITVQKTFKSPIRITAPKNNFGTQDCAESRHEISL